MCMLGAMTKNPNTASDNNNVSTSLAQMEQTVGFIEIVTDDRTPFTFTGYEKLVADINAVRERVAQSEFSTDEERKALNRASAATNKINKAFKNELRDAKARMFATADEQAVEIAASLGELTDEIKARVEHFNNKYREDKAEFINHKITERIVADPQFPDDFNPALFFDAAWLNRTASENSVIREIESRFSAAEAVNAVLAAEVEDSLRLAVERLSAHGFDTAATISQIMADRAAAEAAKVEAERAAVEQAEREAQAEQEREARIREKIAREEQARVERAAAERAEREAQAETVIVSVVVPRERAESFRREVVEVMGLSLADE